MEKIEDNKELCFIQQDTITGTPRPYIWGIHGQTYIFTTNFYLVPMNTVWKFHGDWSTGTKAKVIYPGYPLTDPPKSIQTSMMYHRSLCKMFTGICQLEQISWHRDESKASLSCTWATQGQILHLLYEPLLSSKDNWVNIYEDQSSRRKAISQKLKYLQTDDSNYNTDNDINALFVLHTKPRNSKKNPKIQRLSVCYVHSLGELVLLGYTGRLCTSSWELQLKNTNTNSVPCH